MDSISFFIDHLGLNDSSFPCLLDRLPVGKWGKKHKRSLFHATQLKWMIMCAKEKRECEHFHTHAGYIALEILVCVQMSDRRGSVLVWM